MYGSVQTISSCRAKLYSGILPYSEKEVAFRCIAHPQQETIMKTDTQLQQDVINELKWESSVNANLIGVEVKNGIVTLAGHVSSYIEKLGAERAAQRVKGGNELVVEIEVKLLGSSQRNDADIAQAIKNLLTWSIYAPQNNIKAMVEKGWVTLTGQLNWKFEREHIATLVSHLIGVTGISNQITLLPKVSSTIVKADIEAAIKRSIYGNAKTICVDTNGSDVTLTGTVDSWYERGLAGSCRMECTRRL